MALHRVSGAPADLPLYLHVVPSKEVDRFVVKISTSTDVWDFVGEKLRTTSSIRFQAADAYEEVRAGLSMSRCNAATREILSLLQLWQAVPLGMPTTPDFTPLTNARVLFEPSRNSKVVGMYLAKLVHEDRHTKDPLRRQAMRDNRTLLAALLAVDCQRTAYQRSEFHIVDIQLPLREQQSIVVTPRPSSIASIEVTNSVTPQAHTQRKRSRSKPTTTAKSGFRTSHTTHKLVNPCKRSKHKHVEVTKLEPPTDEEVQAWYKCRAPTCYACGSTGHTNWLSCPSRAAHFPDWVPNMYFLYM